MCAYHSETPSVQMLHLGGGVFLYVCEKCYSQLAPFRAGPLEWAKWPWQRRCTARKEPNSSGYWGRCELKKNHKCDHALERGMDTPRWSTDWTA